MDVMFYPWTYSEVDLDSELLRFMKYNKTCIE